MKKLTFLFTLIYLLNSISASAQNGVRNKPESSVPNNVSRAFNIQFPSQDPVWFIDYQGRYNQQLVYEARFIIDKRYSSAVYDRLGDFVAFAFTVDYQEIPIKIRKYMNRNFPSFSILDAIFVTLRNNDKTYELGILIDGEYIIKVFSEAGEFIKSTRA